MIIDNAPSGWKQRVEQLSDNIHGRSKWRLSYLFFGIIFSQLLPCKKTVTSWLKTIGVGKGFQSYYYFISSLGRLYIEDLADSLCEMVFKAVLYGQKVIYVTIDDTPSRRYGPKVEGAGKHHDHNGKPTDQCFFYGHVWVTLAVVVEHFWYGVIGLPLRSLLYVREQDVPKLPKNSKLPFKTKLELAKDLLDWFLEKCNKWNKKLIVIFDGGYSKAYLLQSLRGLTEGVIAVGRLRRDAALKTLPKPRKPGQRGRPAKYGKKRIHLAKRAGQTRGWQTAEIRGKLKTFKAFHATYRPAGGHILVVLEKFCDGTWAPYFCSEVDMDPIEVLKAVADRWAIEENFREVKETLGASQQQVRNLWANVGCWHLNLWTCVLTYLWSWTMPQEVLVDRSNAPWDKTDRRPSLRDRLRALRRCFMDSVISDFKSERSNEQKIFRLSRWLYNMVA